MGESQVFSVDKCNVKPQEKVPDILKEGSRNVKMPCGAVHKKYNSMEFGRSTAKPSQNPGKFECLRKSSFRNARFIMESQAPEGQAQALDYVLHYSRQLPIISASREERS